MGRQHEPRLRDHRPHRTRLSAPSPNSRAAEAGYSERVQQPVSRRLLDHRSHLFPGIAALGSAVLPAADYVVHPREGGNLHAAVCLGQQQGDTLGPLLFALGLQPALEAVHERFPGVIVRTYIDDIHLVSPDSDVAAAFALLCKLLQARNLQVSFGACKTSAWSPAWETNPSLAVTSAVLGPLTGTTEHIHRCSGGIKTLGTFIGTDTFVKTSSMALTAAIICSHTNTVWFTPHQHC